MTNKVLPLQAILIAMLVCRCNAKCIARYSMSRALPEATGCRHWVTTCSILPRWLPGQQQMKQQCKNTPTLLVVLMAMAMRPQVTARIARWRRSRALLEAIGRHHWASIVANSSKLDIPIPFFCVFWLSTCWKWAQGKRMAPNNNKESYISN